MFLSNIVMLIKFLNINYSEEILLLFESEWPSLAELNFINLDSLF